MSAMLGRGRGRCELQATRTGKSTPALVALRVVALERDAASVYRSIRGPAMDARGAWPAVRYALLSSLSPSHVVELKGAERWEGAADAGAAWDDATGAVCSSGLRAFNTATCVHGVSYLTVARGSQAHRHTPGSFALHRMHGYHPELWWRWLENPMPIEPGSM
jgi:hypothetical protein